MPTATEQATPGELLRAELDAATTAGLAAHDDMINARAALGEALVALGDAQVNGEPTGPPLERVTHAREVLTLAETAASAWERRRRSIAGDAPAEPDADGRTVSVIVHGRTGEHMVNTSTGRRLYGGETVTVSAADALSLVPSYAQLAEALPSWWPKGKPAYVTIGPPPS